MKKIITALGKEEINIELKKEKNFEIITGDIQYKEGILEILENNQDIDFIVLNSLLPGNIDTKELINKINIISRKIKIIIFLEKPNDEFEKYLFENKIYKILYNNEVGINDLINKINNDQLNNEELKQEIENLKELLLKKENNIDKIKTEPKRKNNNKNNNNKIKNKLIFKLNNFFNNINKNEAIKLNIKNKLSTNNKINKNIQNENDLQKKSGKIICILGASGVGKSIISVNLAKANIYSKNKILIIDFDSINHFINTILGVKKSNIKSEKNRKNEEVYNEKNRIIKINKKIDLLFFTEQNINNFILLLNELKKIYNYIIIDTNSIELIEINKEIINFADLILFISGTNLLEINKSIKLLDKYINKLKINKNKFNIIFNKYNSESIDINLLKNIFSEFNILGYLKYNEKYNKLINKNNKNNFLNKKIRNEYLKLNYSIKNKLK